MWRYTNILSEKKKQRTLYVFTSNAVIMQFTTPESIVEEARHFKDNYKYRRANYKKYRILHVVWYRQHEARPDCTFSCVGFAK